MARGVKNRGGRFIVTLVIGRYIDIYRAGRGAGCYGAPAYNRGITGAGRAIFKKHHKKLLTILVKCYIMGLYLKKLDDDTRGVISKVYMGAGRVKSSYSGITSRGGVYGARGGARYSLARK